MSRRKRRSNAPPGKPKQVNLSDVGTDETPTGASRVAGAASTKGGASQFTNQMSVDDFAELRERPSFWSKFSGKEWIEVLALIAMAVGVIWAGYSVRAGIDGVDEKVGSIDTTVTEIKGVVEQNEIRLDNIEESVSDVRREISTTKDAVNELRVETAQQRNSKGDE